MANVREANPRTIEMSAWVSRQDADPSPRPPPRSGEGQPEGRRPLPPTPSPKRRGGAGRMKVVDATACPDLSCSPSPLRGGGWGEGSIRPRLTLPTETV